MGDSRCNLHAQSHSPPSGLKYREPPLVTLAVYFYHVRRLDGPFFSALVN
ncbi:hypothetical protein MGG_16864 [Pyricularia oryzae 70-15]|uniref:Uncharacterized protein n=2 Tax=Pyricularia oryzae TaxID=318829 RepID=G4N477_PYRO7|nr:uncharacterized protein MGG_16864 [Pyricularia oryzae 70-15]EHA52797.1 hypothetical protein MGG_16864 [Pyricularia oryzae 70-15]QBZ59421.1 hypothetical protein PoMZ_04382 [Pyricularia oryzae]